MTFFFVFIGPFLTALATAEDGTGGLAASITGWSTLASSIALAVGGALVEGGEYGRVAWMVIVATGIGVAVLARSRPKRDQNTPAVRAACPEAVVP